MLISIACILVFGFCLGFLCKKINIPPLVGMIAAGIIIGPNTLNLIDSSVLNISGDIRKIALIIILIRAGLTLNLSDLKRIGKSAALMCFLPALLEMVAVVLLAPSLLGISVNEAMLLGSIIAAVSPAVIVPRMIKLIEGNYSTKNGVPQLILAGASVDDIFVIILFSGFLELNKTGNYSLLAIGEIPLSIFNGIVVGVAVGVILNKWLKHANSNTPIKIAVILSIAFVLSALEDMKLVSMFSSLLAIMTIGIVIKYKSSNEAIKLSNGYNKLWIIAEVFLFVLVGAGVNIDYAFTLGFKAFLLIIFALIFRVAGVTICVSFSNMTKKEKLFCVFAYLPKATVQAAIGGVPLAMGLDCGNSALTVAVLSILITAPLGAFLIDISYKKLLNKD